MSCQSYAKQPPPPALSSNFLLPRTQRHAHIHTRTHARTHAHKHPPLPDSVLCCAAWASSIQLPDPSQCGQPRRAAGWVGECVYVCAIVQLPDPSQCSEPHLSAGCVCACVCLCVAILRPASSSSRVDLHTHTHTDTHAHTHTHTRPASSSSRVDFPAPFDPTRTVRLPRGRLAVTSSSTNCEL